MPALLLGAPSPPSSPSYLLALGAHHADLSGPALVGRERGGWHRAGWCWTLVPHSLPHKRSYSHHGPGGPACPGVPRHPSHPSGPGGQMGVTGATSQTPSPSKVLGDPAELRRSPNPDGEDPARAQTSPAPSSPSPRRHPPPPAAPAWWDREGAASEGPRGPPALHRMRAQSQFGSPSITHRLSALPLLALRPLSALRREGEGGEGVLEFVGGCWDPGEGAEGGLRVGVSPARGHRGLCARSQRPAGGEEVAQGGDVAHLCGAGGSPWARAPLGGVGGAAGGTHTLAFLPLGAVGAGQAALTLPSLQEEEGGEV